MKFSIVVPTFNSEKYVAQTLESLVQQTYKNFEVIISDGASSDSTLSIVDSFSSRLNILVRSSKDLGMYDALNQGFSLASGDVYCYLNSDDLYESDTLQQVRDCFESIPECEFLYGNMYIFGESYKQKVVYPPLIKKFFKSVSFSMFGQPSTFWKPELYKAVGGFDAKLKMAGDYDFFCKCIDRNIVRLPLYFSYFRAHTDSLTSNYSQTSLDEMQLIQERYFGVDSNKILINILANAYFKMYNAPGLIKKILHRYVL